MSAWPWPSSEATDKIIPAFVAALQAMPDITKDRKVNMGQGKANYSYADLAAVHDAVKPLLSDAGLAITQAAGNEGVTSVVLHTSGQWISFPALEVRTGQNTPQAHGSALTYARRYALLAALNVATEDDDGQAAATPAPKPVKTAAEKAAEKLYGDLRQLSTEGKQAFRAWRDDRPVDVQSLAADADWRGEVSNWLSEWEHNAEVPA